MLLAAASQQLWGGSLHRRLCKSSLTAPMPPPPSEDVATAAGLNATAKKQLYTDIASGAESGWDFSSRWLANGVNLTTIRTTQVTIGQ
jgi:alpha,alpha-trehalase